MTLLPDFHGEKCVCGHGVGPHHTVKVPTGDTTLSVDTRAMACENVTTEAKGRIVERCDGVLFRRVKPLPALMG